MSKEFLSCREYLDENINRVSFKNVKIEFYPFAKNIDLHKFIIEEKEVYNDFYDVRKIVGSNHPDYIGCTWEKAYKKLKRVNQFEYVNVLNKNDLKYYYDLSARGSHYIDPWRIHEINGKGYISEGNHRSIVTKCLNDLGKMPSKILTSTSVHYINFDEAMAKKYILLKIFIDEYNKYARDQIKLEVESQEIAKIQDDKQTISKFEPLFKIIYSKQHGITSDGKSIVIIDQSTYKNFEKYKVDVEKYMQSLLDNYINLFVYKSKKFYYDYIVKKVEQSKRLLKKHKIYDKI